MILKFVHFLYPLSARASTIKEGRLTIARHAATTGLRQRTIVTARTPCTSIPAVLAPSTTATTTTTGTATAIRFVA